VLRLITVIHLFILFIQEFTGTQWKQYRVENTRTNCITHRRNRV